MKDMLQLTLDEQICSSIRWLTPFPDDVVQTQIQLVKCQVLEWSALRSLRTALYSAPFESAQRLGLLDLDPTPCSRPLMRRTRGYRSPVSVQLTTFPKDEFSLPDPHQRGW